MSIRSSGEMWRRGGKAIALAVALNLVLYVVGTLLVPGGLQVIMTPDTPAQPVPWFMVIIMTAAPMLLGIAALSILWRIFSTRGVMIWSVAAAALALLSMLGPLNAAVGIVAQIVLASMHLVAGGVLVRMVGR